MPHLRSLWRGSSIISWYVTQYCTYFTDHCFLVVKWHLFYQPIIDGEWKHSKQTCGFISTFSLPRCFSVTGWEGRSVTGDKKAHQNHNSNTIILCACNYFSYYTNFWGKIVRQLIEKCNDKISWSWQNAYHCRNNTLTPVYSTHSIHIHHTKEKKKTVHKLQ